MSAVLDVEKAPDGGIVHLENSNEVAQPTKEELARYLMLLADSNAAAKLSSGSIEKLIAGFCPL